MKESYARNQRRKKEDLQYGFKDSKSLFCCCWCLCRILVYDLVNCVTLGWLDSNEWREEKNEKELATAVLHIYNLQQHSWIDPFEAIWWKHTHTHKRCLILINHLDFSSSIESNNFAVKNQFVAPQYTFHLPQPIPIYACIRFISPSVCVF